VGDAQDIVRLFADEHGVLRFKSDAERLHSVAGLLLMAASPAATGFMVADSIAFRAASGASSKAVRSQAV
jgi:hypothetical protein